MQIDAERLIELTKPSNARTLNANYKKLYRHLVVELFIYAIFSKEDFYYEGLRNAEDIYENDIKGTRKHVSDEETKRLEKLGYEALAYYKVKVTNHDQLTELAKFAHEYFKNYKDSNQTLYKYKDVKWWLDLEKIYGISNIKEHVWVDLKPFTHPAPIITFPEYFTYQDMINTWNGVVAKENELLELYKKGYRHTASEYRSSNYAYNSFLRTSLILAVNFVESYLFYYYYNIREQGKYTDLEIVTRGSRSSVKGVDIISELILKKYDITDDGFNELVDTYNQLYLFRHRLVHLSAFEFDNSNLSELQPLINDDEINIDSVSLKLEACIRLVTTVENNLLEEEKLLFWWDTMEYPNFSAKKPISNIRK